MSDEKEAYKQRFCALVNEIYKKTNDGNGPLKGAALKAFLEDKLGIRDVTSFYKWKNGTHASDDVFTLRALAGLRGCTPGQLVDELFGVVNIEEPDNHPKLDQVLLSRHVSHLHEALAAISSLMGDSSADRLKFDLSTYESVSNSAYSVRTLNEAEGAAMPDSRVQRLQSLLLTYVPTVADLDKFLDVFGDSSAIRNVWHGVEIVVDDSLLGDIAFCLRELTSDDAINVAWLRSRIDLTGGSHHLADPSDRKPRSPGRLV